MLKKSSVWLVVLIAVVAIAFIATGCAKKQVVKEEAAAKPAVEAMKEAPPAPAPAPAPGPAPSREEAKPEAPAPPPSKVEAAPMAEKAAPPDLKALRIQFAFDDYNLSTRSKENLEKIAGWLSKDGAARIQVEGHTCDIGTPEYNLALGERRANSAKKYLEGLGVNVARISTISYGEERPMVPNSDEGNRSKNRRDEFLQSR